MTPRAYTVLIAIGGVLLLVLAAALLARGDGMLGALMGISAGGAIGIARERRAGIARDAQRIDEAAGHAAADLEQHDTGAGSTELDRLIAEERDRGR